MKKTETASVRLTEDEKKELERLARLQDRTESWILRKMLLAGLRNQAKHRVSCGREGEPEVLDHMAV